MKRVVVWCLVILIAAIAVPNLRSWSEREGDTAGTPPERRIPSDYSWKRCPAQSWAACRGLIASNWHVPVDSIGSLVLPASLKPRRIDVGRPKKPDLADGLTFVGHDGAGHGDVLVAAARRQDPWPTRTCAHEITADDGGKICTNVGRLGVTLISYDRGRLRIIVQRSNMLPVPGQLAPDSWLPVLLSVRTALGGAA